MKASEVLIQGLAIIEDPARWERHYYATDAKGAPVPPEHPAACKWCSMGALMNVVNPTLSDDDEEGCATISRGWCFLTAAAKAQSNVNIVTLNDSAPHEQVVEAWKAAIKLAEMAGE